MSWPSSEEASPPTRSGKRARVGAVLLVLAMLLWSAAAGVFVQVLLADSDPYAVGTLTALAAALTAAALTAAGGWCTRGSVPHRRFLVGALVVPALLLSVVGAHSRQQEQRERDCPSVVGLRTSRVCRPRNRSIAHPATTYQRVPTFESGAARS